MKLTLLSKEFPDLLPMTDRSIGFHISDVIHQLSIENNRYQPMDKPNRMLWEVGNAFEYAMKARLQEDQPLRYDTPKEIERDGIYGTMDLFDYIDWAVEEMKYPQKSAWGIDGVSENGSYWINEDILWGYWCQLMCYCYMVNSNIGRLHVAFGKGDTSGSEFELVSYRYWEKIWTDSELRANWTMVMMKALVMEQQGFLDEKYKGIKVEKKPRIGSLESGEEKQNQRLLFMIEKVNKDYKGEVPEELVKTVMEGLTMNEKENHA